MNNYLVIIDDGFTYRGIMPSGSGMPAAAPQQGGQSAGVQVSAAIELSSALQEFKSRFPGCSQVIVVTSEVTAGAMQLPPGAADELGFDELNQLVQFELGTRVSFSEVLLGEVLLGRGVLTHAQLQELLLTQKESRQNQSPGGYRQLGVLAVEKGYASQSEIDLALDAQLRMNAPAQDALPLAGVGAELKPSYGTSAGVEVALTTDVVRNKWVSGLKKVGLRLSALLPLAGASRSAVSRQYPDGTLLELYNHCLNVVPLDGSGAVETIPFGGKALDAEQLSSLLARVSGSPKVICTASQELHDLVVATGEHLTPEVELFDTGPGTASLDGLVASSAVSAVNSQSFPVILLKNPPKPLAQQPYTPWVVAAVLFLAAVLVAEGYIKRNLQPLEKDLEAENTAHQAAEDLLGEAADYLYQVEQARDAIAEKSTEVQRSEKELGLIASLQNRSSFHVKLMEVLMDSISEGVVIDNLASSGGDAFELTLWSITPSQGSQFVEELSKRLTREQLTMEVMDTRAGSGRVDIEGTELVVRISPQIESIPVEAEGAGNVE